MSAARTGYGGFLWQRHASDAAAASLRNRARKIGSRRRPDRHHVERVGGGSGAAAGDQVAHRVRLARLTLGVQVVGGAAEGEAVGRTADAATLAP